MVSALTGRSDGNYRWYVLAILTIAQTCHGIDRAIIGLVLKPVGDEFSLSGEQMGILAGLAYGIPFAIAALPFGYAVDRFNRKNLMTFALSAWSAATAACGAATGFWTMLMGRAAVGVAEAGGSPTGMSLLSDYFGTDKRSTAIGIWYLSTGIGTALAFFVGGWIVELYGWRWAFVAAGIPGLMLAPLLFLTIKEPKRGQQDEPSDEASGPFAQRTRELMGRPGIFFCIAAITCIATGIYGMSTWLATFLITSHDLAISSAGMVVAISYGILGSVGNLIVGWGTDRINASRGGFNPALTSFLGAIIPFLTAIAALAAVATDDTTLAIGLIFAAGLFSASYNGPIYAVIVTIAGPQLRGLAVSFVQLSANFIGVGLGAWLIGRVADEVGGQDGVAWGIAAAMMFCIFGGIFLLLASRQISKSQTSRS
ncbi:MFS transporter [Croceicoccus sp. F390]|uniref:MFS transporter n=1 Tax=Croceicoccus esteveae TaxID=3075597 RepID=A0ABU2ZI80_9SPHN|nr:MFS transporter [Croceicoccus sp. F390]MDT0576305.1 MFS transporter [Croceicoccus sp. F390]